MAGGYWVWDVEGFTREIAPERGPLLLCAAAEEVYTGEKRRWVPDHLAAQDAAGARPLSELPGFLNTCDRVTGHNIAGYDIPLVEQCYPGWKLEVPFEDTLAISRLIFYSHITPLSFAFRNSGGKGQTEQQREARMPGRLLSSHSLEAWGYRLGNHKVDFFHGLTDEEIRLTEYSPALLDYCAQDVSANGNLARFLEAAVTQVNWPQHSALSRTLESRVTYILGLQERNGVGFDDEAALALELRLRERLEATRDKLREQFPPWWSRKGQAVFPRKDRKSSETRREPTGETKGHPPSPKHPQGRTTQVHRKVPGFQPGTREYVDVQKDCAYQPIELVEFNPGSAIHLERVLRKLGWEPTSFGGDPANPVATCDEETFADLSFPCMPDIREYQLVSKRLGSLSDGRNAWRKLCSEAGTIHGRVWSVGARTNRMSHNTPNITGVPKVINPYGPECRALFRPTRRAQGWVQVGADGSGIQLRALGHRMSPYDGGAFAEMVIHGDVHTAFQKATGFFERERQKTYTYAMLFGAFDLKLGTIVLEDWRAAYEAGLTDQPCPDLDFAKHYGELARAKLESQFTALADLKEDVAECYARHNPEVRKPGRREKRRGFGHMTGLDGRIIPVKSEHSSLNDLLQSDEAVLMKQALVILYDRLTEIGWDHGVEYAFMINAHDEWQIECPPENAELLGQTATWAIVRSGEVLGYTIPLAGEFKIGANWAETH